MFQINKTFYLLNIKNHENYERVYDETIYITHNNNCNSCFYIVIILYKLNNTVVDIYSINNEFIKIVCILLYFQNKT